MQKKLKKAFELHQNNQFESAKEIYLELLKDNNQNIQLLTLMGTIEYQLKLYDNAENYLAKSLSIDNNQFIAHQNIGIIFSIKGNDQKSIEHLKKAIDLNPNYYHSYNELAQIYMKKKQYEEALIYYNKAISINPNYIQGLNNRGSCLREMQKPEKALVDLNKAINHEPNYFEAYLNKGNCLKDLGKLRDAQRNYEISLSFNENYEMAKYNLSILHLFNGNFKEGWKYYDSRWHETKYPSFTYSIPTIKNINEVDNILLWGEQGIGDQIIFISLLGELNFNKKITVAVDPRLIRIYKRSYPKINFINLYDNIDASKFKHQLPLANLGSFYRTSKNSFAKQVKSFLKSNYQKTHKFKKEIRSKKRICGVSWKSHNKSFGLKKSIPLPALFKLFKIEKLDFIDLQYDSTVIEKKHIKNNCNIELKSISKLDKFNDLDSLLSLIDACDFVITCCNVTAHLAGSIGKKTYLIVPFGLGTLWYWHGNSTSYWYPTISLYKQESLNDWENVIGRIIKDLKI